ncbi:tRNA pseudouridine(55) synthase TruB [Angustibacter sp. McL0619]|uniref:tRNA pseudouridine(55) synthase TruB n=1 Tax=Angustibacter sp. McL0619 TaxID=3415676 RepID=UPI003CFA97F8
MSSPTPPGSERRPTAPDGLVIVDKPTDWTSHDVVARMRRLAGTRKVGHAGTLDPMATGVLVIGVGRATRLLTYLVGADKTYTATIRLGVSTVTDDAQGEVTQRRDAARLAADQVGAAVTELTGAIEQVPSSVSAIKVAGQRSYARVRAGEQVELAARAVTVHRFDVLGSRTRTDQERGVLDLDVEVDVSSGTYVRALARDLGDALGVGGHLTALRRTRVGPYALAGARTLDQLESEQPLTVLSLADAARAAFACRDLTADEVRALRYGQRVPPTGAHDGSPGQPVAGIGPGGDLVALLEDRDDSARSVLVVPPSE